MPPTKIRPSHKIPPKMSFDTEIGISVRRLQELIETACLRIIEASFFLSRPTREALYTLGERLFSVECMSKSKRMAEEAAVRSSVRAPYPHHVLIQKMYAHGKIAEVFWFLSNYDKADSAQEIGDVMEQEVVGDPDDMGNSSGQDLYEAAVRSVEIQHGWWDYQQ